MDERPTGRELPPSLDIVLGEMINIWKKTNPEAIRELYKWNEKADNFLLVSRDEQLEIIKKRREMFHVKLNRGQIIENQVDELKKHGMLPNKEQS